MQHKSIHTYANSHTRNDKQTYGYFATGSAKNLNVSVSLSTLDKDDTNATGTVQKMHRVTENTKLRNSPTVKIGLIEWERDGLDTNFTHLMLKK